MKKDISELIDRDEAVSSTEPLLISGDSKHRGALNDLALELATSSARFRGSLPKYIERSLADVVRSMNCYYSNLIEGHDTHPVDIERALKDDYSTNTKQPNLQLEAKAHIAVQQWIDDGGLKNKAASTEGLCEIHKRFGELLPDELLWIHPFLDGNGRVARLMSYAMLLDALDAGGI